MMKPAPSQHCCEVHAMTVELAHCELWICMFWRPCRPCSTMLSRICSVVQASLSWVTAVAASPEQCLHACMSD